MPASTQQEEGPDTDFIRALGRVIKYRRQRLGLNQDEFSLRTNLHRTYISDLERGTRHPTTKSLLALANGLGLTIVDLIKETHELIVKGDSNVSS